MFFFFLIRAFATRTTFVASTLTGASSGLALTPLPPVSVSLRMVDALGKEIAAYEVAFNSLQKFQEDNSLITAPTVT